MLKLTNGNIVEIVDITFNGTITYDVYENEAHKASGDTDFLKHYQSSDNVDLVPYMANTPDAGISIYDNIIKQGYEALKTLPEFNLATDV